MSTITIDFDKIKNDVLPALRARRDYLRSLMSRYELDPDSRKDIPGRQMYANICSAYNEVCKKITYFERILVDYGTNIKTVTDCLNDIHIDDLSTPNFTVQ